MGKNKTLIQIPFNADDIVIEAARSFAEIIGLVLKEKATVIKAEKLNLKLGGFIFATFDKFDAAEVCLSGEMRACYGEGFCVTKKGGAICVLSHFSSGVYYGAHELLERNLPVVFARGAKEESVQFLPVKNCEWKNCEFCENAFFNVRSWNLCGIGSEGKGHCDDGTVQNLSRNKMNSVFHTLEEPWRKYGVFHNGKRVNSVQCFDDVADIHPEYFMTDANGKPKKAFGGYESFPNYFNNDAADFLAERLVDGMQGSNEDDIVHWTMPDNSYFYCVKDGVKLHEQPFTCDDGTVVYPKDKNYKSTVYFNFLNRLIKRANQLRPNTYLSAFAYIYSEPAPAIPVDERLIITVAPINTNEKYSYIDERALCNVTIRENIKKWAEKTANLYLYTYWQCFQSANYSRPILKTVKENLLWFKKIGVRGVTIESTVDCSYSNALSDAQKRSRLSNDMNQAYIWAIQKLIWNPEVDIDSLIERYVKIVYKECAQEMKEYFDLLQYGWDKSDATVWYTTGGDIYYLQFIVNAGISDKILKTLSAAQDKAATPSVKRTVAAIKEVVEREILKYKDFVKEEAFAVKSSVSEAELLSKRSLDYVNERGSVWNSAKPLEILRYPRTMEYYPAEAKFSLRIMYDDENLYFGYTVFDKDIVKVETVNGVERCYRADGTEFIGVSETYIGGDVLNQSTYYGYISGFMDITRNVQGEFYKNDGAIKSAPMPSGVKTVRHVHLDDNPENRYCFHVQIIPFAALNESINTVKPYGSFTFVSDKYGCAGWMGYGLWNKQNFQRFNLVTL